MVLEKSLTSKLLRDLHDKVPSSWFHKLPDPSRCPRCGAIGRGDKRPFDLVGCVEGKAVAIEVKTRSVTDLLPHQDAALRLFAQSGGVSYVLVGSTAYTLSPGPLKTARWVSVSETLFRELRNL